MQPSGKRAAGFTHIELLVGLVIILISSGVLLTALPRIMTQVDRGKCVSNMRQIGLALNTYVAEHHGNFPRTRHVEADEEQAWIYQLRPYLADIEKVRVSPADPNRAQRLEAEGTSYILNDAVIDPRLHWTGQELEGSIGNIYRLERPGATILGFIVSDNRGTGATNDHTHVNNWTMYQRFLRDVEADRHRVGARSTNRDQGNANYLYADGSVRLFEAAEIKSYFDRGINIGRPNQAP